MSRFASFFYDRYPEACETKKWHALAYYSPTDRRLVMVVWPFHYVVRGYRWVEWQWDKYRHRDGWIAAHVKRATAKEEAWQIVEPALSFAAEAEFLPKQGYEDIRRALKHARQNTD